MTKEQDLVKRICSGDESAFEQLITENRPLVELIVFRLIPNSADREEICQEIFLRVFQSIKQFRFKSSLRTWIGKITYNTCLNTLRKKSPHLFADIQNSEKDDADIDVYFRTDTVHPDDYTENRNRTEILKKMIAKLPALYRTILSMYHMDGRSYAEISEIMELPQGTVKSYLFRARKALKEQLEAQFQGEEI